MKNTHIRKIIPISFKIHILLIFLLIIGTLPSFGQGTVKGIITDKSDQTPLVSANIFIQGTTIGTVSNFNGEYILPLKAGTYTIEILYLGYEAVMETITIEDNQTIELNKELTPITIMGEEVVVTMQARGQLSAVNQQLNSNKIINVVSEERIRELPDENAAQALSRLPGIHLDGSKVVIRGVESKMNKIMINGIDLPSTEENNRATDLGIISANMLSGIEVYKTLTPDMDADAVGGVVNLKFREAQPGLHYSVTTQGAYNQQEKLYGGSKIWGNVSNRFFDKRLGAILNVNYETKNGGEDWITASYNQKDQAPPGEGVYMLNSVDVYDQLKTKESIGGSLVIDYDIGNGQILFTSLLSSSLQEETRYRDAMQIGSEYHEAYLNRSKYSSLITNNSLSLEQQLGRIKLEASISNTRSVHDPDFDYQSRVRHDTPPFLNDSITEPKKLKMEPVDVYNTLDPTADNAARYYETRIIPKDYNESQWIADIDLEVPLRLTDNIDVNFKFGGKYIRKDRFYDATWMIDYYPNVVQDVNHEIADYLGEYGIDPEGGGYFFRDIRDYDYQPNKGYMNDEGYYLGWVLDKEFFDGMILDRVNLDPETTSFVSHADDGRDDYWGWESKTAGYIMAEINLGKKITIIPGFRYEQVHKEYSAKKVNQNTQWIWAVEDTITKPADNSFLLPHLHLRLKATDWWDIRFSYNNTLTRPDYNYSIPIVYYHIINGGAEVGNPNVKPAVSENYDANFTFYSRKMGLITIGGYYKRITDIFYKQPTLIKNIEDTVLTSELPTDIYPSILNSTQDYYVNSPYAAEIKGMEVEWQSNFTWLPTPFNGLVLNANYTRVWSETKYMQDRTDYDRGQFPPILIEVDTFFTNRLLHQANDIANFSVGYDYKGLSARMSFRFQGNVISKIGSRPEENEYTEDIYAYDFVIKQKIPLKVGQFEIFANAINFTNVPVQRRYSTFKTTSGNDRDALTYERYAGRKLQLGLRYSF